MSILDPQLYLNALNAVNDFGRDYAGALLVFIALSIALTNFRSHLFNLRHRRMMRWEYPTGALTKMRTQPRPLSMRQRVTANGVQPVAATARIRKEDINLFGGMNN